LPLIVNHGWPGSVIEQLKIIDPLTDPAAHGASAADAFHVVIPSMPGYGFSGKPANSGWGPERMGGVPPPDLGGVGPGRQPLGHELADGLQHPRPGPEPGTVEVDQAMPGQRLRQLQRPVPIQVRGPWCAGRGPGGSWGSSTARSWPAGRRRG
jgi:pimeloyl-ACP methyl ester carboxylesterase